MAEPAALPSSPCVRNCCLNPANDVCLGCFRHIDEITGWQQAGAEERGRILERCAQRRDAHAQTLRERMCAPK